MSSCSPIRSLRISREVKVVRSRKWNVEYLDATPIFLQPRERDPERAQGRNPFLHPADGPAGHAERLTG